MNEKLISKKKPFYPISIELSKYLKEFNRWINGSIFYEDLLFNSTVTINTLLWVVMNAVSHNLLTGVRPLL